MTAWILTALAWLLLVVAEKLASGPTSCPLSAQDSIYGQAEWSWLPPGTKCTWTATVQGSEITFTQGPSSYLLYIGVGLVTTAAAFFLGRKIGRAAR